MKKRILVAAILIFPLVVFLFFWCQPGALKLPVVGQSQVAQDAAVAKALATASPQANAVIASNFAAVRPAQNFAPTAPAKSFTAVSPSSTLEFTNLPPDIVLENMRHAIRNYSSRFGGNPVGTNPEIARALVGENPGQVNFMDADAGLRLNAAGELVDPWGTPYFFHQLSATEMEIHSAGPDKVMWTRDDLVIK